MNKKQEVNRTHEIRDSKGRVFLDDRYGRINLKLARVHLASLLIHHPNLNLRIIRITETIIRVEEDVTPKEK